MNLQSKNILYIWEVIGYSAGTEQHLQFAPRCVIEEAIDQEMKDYQRQNSFEEFEIRLLSKRRNIITSTHFFQSKKDGDDNKLKLECNLAPHGKRDIEKGSTRNDSSTAQFFVIRISVSILAMFPYASYATLDIKSAYFQGENLPREEYTRPPKCSVVSSFTVWQLLKYTYGLSASERIWQLVDED